MNIKTEFLYAIITASIITLACLPLILIGPQAGHSIYYNLPWSRGFAEQLIAGELYPRWLIDMNTGAGSPVFFFYAPLPFYVVSLGHILCQECKTTIQLGFGEALLIISSGLSFYLFARSHAKPIPSTVGAILYALMPYHFAVDLLERQAIGEVASYIWMPLTLFFIDRLAKEKPSIVGLALSYSLLISSHLPATVLFSIFLLLYAWISTYKSGSSRLPLRLRFLVSMLVGIGLSGMYTVPALFSLKNIRADAYTKPDYLHYDQWFFLDGIESPNPPFTNRLFLALAISTCGFVVMWAIAWLCHRDLPERKRLFTWLLFAAGAWFVMTPLSQIIWKALPFLQMVQFPWRVSIVLDLAIAATIVLAMQCVTTKRKWISLCSIGMSALLFMTSFGFSAKTFRQHWWLSRSNQYQEELNSLIRLGCDAVEYIPPEVEIIITKERPCAEIGNMASTNKVSFDSPTGEVKVVRWRPRDIILDVVLPMETNLTVRQFFYPAWQARIAGSNTSLGITPSRSTGLLKLAAPSGRYQLVLQLEPLWQEVVGAILSGLSLLVLLGFTVINLCTVQKNLRAHLEIPRKAPELRKSGH